MTLLGWWGFDSGSTLKYPEFNQTVGSNTGRDGVTAHSTGWSGNNDVLMTIPGGAQTGIVLGAAWLHGGVGTGVRVASFRLGVTTLSYVSFDALGKLTFYAQNGVALASAAAITPVNVWLYYEIKFVPHPSAGSIKVRVNEVEVLSFTGATAAVATTVDGIVFNGSNQTNGCDDMYLLNFTDETATAGRPNNDYLGDVKVAHLLPTADGSTVTMTPSTGTNHAALVDEHPPNQTDWVSALGGGTVKDFYQMSDLPAIAVTVFGVRTLLYAAKTDAGAAALKPAIRESNGTETMGPAQPLSTTYTGYGGPFHKTKAAGGVFTPADINAIQAGAQVA